MLRKSGLVVGICSLFVLVACSGPERVAPAPAGIIEQTTVLDIPNARFWADSQAEGMAREGLEALKRERAAIGERLGSDGQLPPAYFIAISGGGDDGAFAAGLLCGWADSGKMPNFKLVTGVSTGSMIAPLLFLGPPYRDRLRAVYTTIKPSDILSERGVVGAVFGDALMDSRPLANLIARYFDQKMLADIAAEYNRGRLLLIGTTNLDAQRPVIWNIGAIAASGRPGSLELVRKIVLASAAVPGVFPPVMIDVEAGGRRYQEMNVDGGAVAQTFLYPPAVTEGLNLRQGALARERHAYVIRNARLDPDMQEVERRFLTITGRAISTMIRSSGYNDLFRIYATSQRDGVDFNLAYIERDFPPVPHEDFDPAYLKALFNYGYERGRAGYRWHKAPPAFEQAPATEPKAAQAVPVAVDRPTAPVRKAR